jgi:hypothetical protein
MNTLKLPSTLLGHASTIFWAFVWIMIFLIVGDWLSGIAYDRADYSEDTTLFAYIAYCFAVGIAGIILIGAFFKVLYGMLEVSTFYKDKEGHWGKLVGTCYGFPFSKSTEEWVFDRIVKVTIEQSSVDRIFGTGTLKITMVIFTNADAEKTKWYIPAIKHVHDAKEQIMAALPNHEGVRIQMQPADASH